MLLDSQSLERGQWQKRRNVHQRLCSTQGCSEEAGGCAQSRPQNNFSISFKKNMKNVKKYILLKDYKNKELKSNSALHPPWQLLSSQTNWSMLA